MSNQPLLNGNRFVVLGRAGMDFSPEPAGTRIEDATTFSTSLGGSSANICVALTRLGGQASMVTCVSDDAVGRYCLNQLDHYGVERQHVRSVGGEFRNSLAVSESRIEQHQTVIYRNGAADFQMSLADVEAVDYSKFSALITTGTVLAVEPSRSAAFRAFELARQARTIRPDIKILLTSGFAYNDLDSSDLELAYSILDKPYNKSQLLNTIDRVMNTES